MQYERIRNLRVQRGISQREIAKELNISFVAYQNIENGKSDFKISNLIKLCEFFSVTPDYLLGYEE